MTSTETASLFSIQAAAQEAPDHPALITDQQSWTYAQLAEEVAAVAATLEPERDRFLVATNTVESLVRLYSLMELGVPAVLLHPRWTERERPSLQAPLPGGEGLSCPTLAILFTSGSTDQPKGVILSRRAFAASAAAGAANLGWQPDDRWLLAMPTAHVGGLSIVTRCLAARKTVVLDTSSRFDPTQTARRLERHRVTLLSLVPTMLHRLLRLDPPWQPPETLRAVLLGGAPASATLLAEATARRVPVLTTYGMTETCSQVATQEYSTRFQDPRQDHGAGPPLPGVEVRIVPSSGTETVGEIQIRGAMLMDGYLSRPSPLTQDGWFPSGDAGYLDEAERLHPLRRQGDMILTGGENVYPAEVEAALMEHPTVVAACVVGLPDEEWGERLAALLVAREGTTAPSDAAFETWLRERLAPFRRPRLVRWVPALPLNPNGKVDPQRVRDLLS